MVESGSKYPINHSLHPHLAAFRDELIPVSYDNRHYHKRHTLQNQVGKKNHSSIAESVFWPGWQMQWGKKRQRKSMGKCLE
jgi:hypothetical protein